MSDYIKKMKCRYSCKNFSPEKKVTSNDIDEIIQIFRLAPSMLNIQPWKLFIIKDDEKKQVLQSYSANQKQVWINSHVLVFARKQKIDEKHIRLISNWLKESEVAFETIQSFMNTMSEKEQENWSITQVSIALGNVISFLAEKEIDSCPIWIFDREKYDEFLWLTQKWYNSVFALVIWYAAKKRLFPIKKRLDVSHIVEYID